jgi:shikimate kinase
VSDRDDRNVVLTGFMGTGKSTVARVLAERLGFRFVDTDAVIEERHGPIATIFAQQGEESFRVIEREVAAELAGQRSLVIATGGRLMLDPENAAALGAEAHVFCLTADVDVILGRVLADESRVERPLLRSPDPRARIVELLDERRAGYERFPHVDTDGRSPEDVAEEIVRRRDVAVGT